MTTDAATQVLGFSELHISIRKKRNESLGGAERVYPAMLVYYVNISFLCLGKLFKLKEFVLNKNLIFFSISAFSFYVNTILHLLQIESYRILNTWRKTDSTSSHGSGLAVWVYKNT